LPLSSGNDPGCGNIEIVKYTYSFSGTFWRLFFNKSIDTTGYHIIRHFKEMYSIPTNSGQAQVLLLFYSIRGICSQPGKIFFPHWTA